LPVAGRLADVFLNIPFAASHEYLYIALVAGLVGLRLNPRCVLEVAPQQSRLQRPYKLIASCPYSIHDLSRSESKSSARMCSRHERSRTWSLPRANWPKP